MLDGYFDLVSFKKGKSVLAKIGYGLLAVMTFPVLAPLMFFAAGVREVSEFLNNRTINRQHSRNQNLLRTLGFFVLSALMLSTALGLSIYFIPVFATFIAGVVSSVFVAASTLFLALGAAALLAGAVLVVALLFSMLVDKNNRIFKGFVAVLKGLAFLGLYLIAISVILFIVAPVMMLFKSIAAGLRVLTRPIPAVLTLLLGLASIAVIGFVPAVTAAVTSVAALVFSASVLGALGPVGLAITAGVLVVAAMVLVVGVIAKLVGLGAKAVSAYKNRDEARQEVDDSSAKKVSEKKVGLSYAEKRKALLEELQREKKGPVQDESGEGQKSPKSHQMGALHGSTGEPQESPSNSRDHFDSMVAKCFPPRDSSEPSVPGEATQYSGIGSTN